MPQLFTSTGKLIKGVEYNGIVPRGNSIIFTDNKCKISVNRGLFVPIPAWQTVVIHPDYTYMVDKDEHIITTHEVVEGSLSVFYAHQCPTSLTLSKNTESGHICQVDSGYKDTTKGTIQARATIKNPNNSHSAVKFKIYVAGNLEHEAVTVASKKSTVVLGVSVEVEDIASTTVLKNKEIHFTLEVDHNNLTTVVDPLPQLIQIERRNT